MKDGIFTDTMADMTWPAIQAHAQKNALVLIPIGVIEEHGPHLALGTDIYTAYLQCVFIKDKLKESGLDAIIAPPFYWGICQSTGSFIGSMRIRKETATGLLLDIISSLAEFGFRNVFGINAHGDIEQHIAIIEAFKGATESKKINARYAFSEGVMHHYGLNGREPYICPIAPQSIKVSSSETPDVHGGDIETATMNLYYPHLTDTEKAKALPPVQLGDDKIMSWLFGGQTSALSPEGYVGAPADYESVDVIGNLKDIANRVSASIAARVIP